MESLYGDLIEMAESGVFDVIVHGCNCQNTMGAGMAKSIKARFPAAYEADLATERGSRSKLGTISTAIVPCGSHSLTVVNAYTQFDWRGPGAKVDYNAIRSAFRQVRSEFAGSRIGYPLIGAGLGGGDWSVISTIIDDELSGEDHSLVRYRPTS